MPEPRLDFTVHRTNAKTAPAIAACAHAEDAACIIAGTCGPGAQIRYQRIGPVLWTEGAERQPAAESYDYVATTCAERLKQAEEDATARLKKTQPSPPAPAAKGGES